MAGAWQEGARGREQLRSLPHPSQLPPLSHHLSATTSQPPPLRHHLSATTDCSPGEQRVAKRHARRAAAPRSLGEGAHAILERVQRRVDLRAFPLPLLRNGVQQQRQKVEPGPCRVFRAPRGYMGYVHSEDGAVVWMQLSDVAHTKARPTI